jgi:hypothetical protein
MVAIAEQADRGGGAVELELVAAQAGGRGPGIMADEQALLAARGLDEDLVAQRVAEFVGADVDEPAGIAALGIQESCSMVSL